MAVGPDNLASMLTARLVLRALRWRAGAAVCAFVVATIAVAAAALGPMYLRAVDGGVLRQTLDAAPRTAESSSTRC